MNRIKIALSFCYLGASTIFYAQDRKVAAELFEFGNFTEALDEYLELLNEEPDNIEYNYNVAVCFLNTNIDKSKAIPYLEKLVENPKITSDAFYLLGRAYQYGYRFDDAMHAFDQFIQDGKGSESNMANVDAQIDYCQNAKELMKFPKSVKFENLGRGVNSRDDDYFPFIPTNEEFIIFNSTREDRAVEPQSNGQYLPNIYISYEENGKFSETKKLPGVVNTSEGKQEIVGLNSTGSKAVFYFEDFNQSGDIFQSGIEGKGVKKPMKMPSVINSKSTEIAGCFTDDNQKFFFASDREGGYGGTDLYVCQRLPNGNWSMAQNLGPSINTSSDEDFPNISPDGKFLFFSSKGHASMGGYDIFKARWDDVKKKFQGVQNMGYPINTPEDNMNFRMSESGKYGYVSAIREGGQGGLDIYRVDFLEVEPKYTVLSGEITNDKGVAFEDLFISVMDSETEEIYGDYLPNPKTNRYVIILPPGKYNIYVGAIGYEEIYEDVEILDKTSFKSFLNKDYKMISNE